MKRYFNFTLIIALTLAITLSLTSCFTSSYEYVEWELSDDERSITDGKETYKLYADEDFKELWQPSGYSCLHYMNEVYSSYNQFASISASLKEEGIIALDIYENDYFSAHVGKQLYATEEGKKILDSIEHPVLSSSAYAFNFDDGMMGALTDEVVAMILSLKDEQIVTKSFDELESSQQITVSALALDGFLIHNFGVFYFNFGEIYYRPKDTVSDLSKIPVYKLNEADRAILNPYIESGLNLSTALLEVEYEEGTLAEGDDSAAKLFSRIVLLCAVFILGIAVPVAPIALSLVLVKKRNWRFILTDYLLLVSSGIWLISGIILFIILLF